MGNSSEVDISWESARETNRENWDDRAALHEVDYGVDRYVQDKGYISTVVADDLPVLREHLHRSGLAGADVMHLQCHIGTDTISLARCGAKVTGLDFSSASLAAARRLAAATGTDIKWVQGDVLEASALIDDEFDVVYTSIGTICWLADLGRWAGHISALLKPGGVFFIRDAHPVMYALDEKAPDLRMTNRYFASERAQTFQDNSTYVGTGTVDHDRTYEWIHPLSEIVGSLLSAGLVIERLDEGRTLPWQFSPRMVSAEGERFSWPEAERERVPCTFTIVARKPDQQAVASSPQAADEEC
ncbi:MAG: class I SAM-dependent methyltransferase [Actinomycetota bacterium]|nr:class I SAM-dependent methyltransferase [Actinomycetota bacterium]